MNTQSCAPYRGFRKNCWHCASPGQIVASAAEIGVVVVAVFKEGGADQFPFASIHAARVSLHHIADLVFVDKSPEVIGHGL
jgi:hypothetical protein